MFSPILILKKMTGEREKATRSPAKVPLGAREEAVSAAEAICLGSVLNASHANVFHLKVIIDTVFRALAPLSGLLNTTERRDLC